MTEDQYLEYEELKELTRNQTIQSINRLINE